MSIRFGAPLLINFGAYTKLEVYDSNSKKLSNKRSFERSEKVPEGTIDHLLKEYLLREGATVSKQLGLKKRQDFYCTQLLGVTGNDSHFLSGKEFTYWCKNRLERLRENFQPKGLLRVFLTKDSDGILGIKDVTYSANA